MKGIYNLFSIVVTVILLSGCSRVLNVSPDGTLTLEQIFSDNEKVAAYLNTCYSYVPAKGNWYYFVTSVPSTLSDEAWDADDCVGLRVVQYYNGNVSAASNPLYEDMPGGNKRMGTYWKYYWTAIRNCAEFLAHIDKASVNSEIDRDRWRAEAHILRAYYYMELLKWYGAALPLSEDPYVLDQDFSGLKQATYGEVIKFIVTDCDKALSSGNLPWRITTEAEKMRVTKAVAEAIKSKAVLFAVSPRYDDGTYSKEDAYGINKQSLQNLRNNGYELYNKDNSATPQTVFTDPFRNGVFSGPKEQALINAAGACKQYFCGDMEYSASPWDKETIWQHQVKQDRQWLVASFLARFKCGACPSQEYVDAFEATDGIVAHTVLDPVTPYGDEKHLQPNYNPSVLTYNYNGTVNSKPLYDKNNPYRNRDPRFYATVYYNGSKRFIVSDNAWMTIWTDKDDPRTGIRPGNSDANRAYTRTGYYAQKYLHPTEGPQDLTYFGAGWRLFRLGEMILNTAELAIEAGHPAEAVALVNEIRRRSAMPEITPANPGDQAEMRRIVRQERRIEMGFEEARYFDIRRWLPKGGSADLRETDRWVTAMEIADISTGKDHSMLSYIRRPVRDLQRECYTGKYLLQPLPLDEATRLETITGHNWQNPGW